MKALPQLHQKLFSTVIFLGPGNDLYPLITKKMPKFNLPVLDETLIDINVRWVKPISSKIFIVVLEELKGFVEDIARVNNIEIIAYRDYEGTYNVLRKISPLLSEHVAVFKADLMPKIDADRVCAKYWEKENFLVVFTKSEKSKDIVGYKNSDLHYYHNDLSTYKEIDTKYIMELNEMAFSTKLELLQIYFINKKHFSYDFDEFSLQKDILPLMIAKLKDSTPVQFTSITELEIKQIKNLQSYMEISLNLKNERVFPTYAEENIGLSEYKNKNRVSFKGHKNNYNTIANSGLFVGENTKLTNCILGKNVVIGKNCKIKHCIIMDNVRIGSNCYFENCIISQEAVVCDGVNITNCQVTFGYSFEESTRAEDRGFIAYDPEDNKNVEIIGFSMKGFFEETESAEANSVKIEFEEEGVDNKDVTVKLVNNTIDEKIRCHNKDIK